MALSTKEQAIYDNLLAKIQALPVGCPVLIRQDYCEILGVMISSGQAKRFGIELHQNTPDYLKHIKLATNNLNSYMRV